MAFLEDPLLASTANNPGTKNTTGTPDNVIVDIKGFSLLRQHILYGAVTHGGCVS